MSVRVTEVDSTDHGFSLLVEQDVAVTAQEFDLALGRPRGMGRWFGIHVTWPMSPDDQLHVGSAIEFDVPVGPFTFDYVMIVADRVPGESLMLRTTKGFADMIMEYAWQPTSSGVTVQLRADFRLRGGLRWKRPWARMMAERRLAQGLERMRRDLAAGQPGELATSSTEYPSRGTGHGVRAAAHGRHAGTHRKATGRRRAQRA
ncbi:hypothetical protein GKZ75_08625 [Kocuria indica]|uniref:SRPBCC family protein n=1 Tax=Kocuria marina subsp. indica TaxID=1049583 RepID=A0A6N9QYH0_9MICC|nr:hypothetical protein [Kocuria indica]NDO78285.1 hypothetical protein [Kocuria indica]